jgi:hypothetical protein
VRKCIQRRARAHRNESRVGQQISEQAKRTAPSQSHLWQSTQHVCTAPFAQRACPPSPHLHPRAAKVVHQSHEGGQDLLAAPFLDVGAQVGAHLAQGLARRPPHLHATGSDQQETAEQHTAVMQAMGPGMQRRRADTGPCKCRRDCVSCCPPLTLPHAGVHATDLGVGVTQPRQAHLHQRLHLGQHLLRVRSQADFSERRRVV